MIQKFKTILFVSFLLTLLVPVFSKPLAAQADVACTAEITFVQKTASGQVYNHPSGNSIQIADGESYWLHYKIHATGKNEPCFGTYYYRLGQDGTKVLHSASTTIAVDDTYPLDSVLNPPKPGSITFDILISQSPEFRGLADSDATEINFVAGNNTPPTPSSDPYQPQNVTVCNLGSTTATICWTTNSESNSEVVYGTSAQTLDSDSNKPNFKSGTAFNLKTHSIALTRLTAATAYKFIARSSPNAQTTSTTSSEMTFTTKNADGTGGSSNTNANSNTGNPNSNINTNVGVSLGNLDEHIGSFFNPLTKDTLPELLATILRILFALIGTVAVIIIIIAGFRMVLASGNQTELTKAKAAITWAVIGLVIALMAFSIVAIIQKLIQG
ncbi:MAG TPA: fibronectin type III domain-containing protein [Patescibacteria group bacterium]|jgi:uncharacterized protein YaiE (UPF0345 family)|nr:fibronectin type III domain-containing protein [Patescibacteria group bacterium]